MKIITRVDMDKDAINITSEFHRQLIENCDKTSTKYKNCMMVFQERLQEVADKAFELGKWEAFKKGDKR